MMRLIVAVLLAMHVQGVAAQPAAQPAAQQLAGEGARAYADFRPFGPQRAFAVSAEGKGFWYAGSSGADPGRAVEAALKNCQDKAGGKCVLYAINNIVLGGREWKAAAPAAAPPIGRLRGQPWWENTGPRTAAGLIVWSHGYRSGNDATSSAPQPWVGRFTALGYDLYRFDREWIRDWPGDATQLVEAVRQAKAMGDRRIILAGQSAGGWVSLAATMRGAPVDGVISISAAHHGEVKDMRDVSIARSEWQQIIRGIKPGPRLVVVNFAGDT